MDQFSHNNEAVPLKLPEVQLETKGISQDNESVAKSVHEKSLSKAIEQNTMNNPLANTSAPAVMPIRPNAVQLSDSALLINNAGATKKIIVTDDLSANDSDLIEKAWVIKAKAIVEQTKNNPYEQTSELKKIREDYQNKRFKTNLKIDKE